MWIWALPLLGGEPPSVAMRLKNNSGCSSLSRGFSKTNSMSLFLGCLKETLKYSFSGSMV
uniref:Uncharacterized protein n=1 Tax=Anser brachyrhynchus TaxID=132585 RepID=A0A8B9CDP8_9AVES